MGKFKQLWRKCPAKLRAILNIIILALSAVMIYVLLGSPPFSPTDAFRRAEKANFTGPSEILAVISRRDTPYTHLILGDQGEGATLFTYKFRDQEATELIYTDKTNGMALLAVPGAEELAIAKSAQIPLALFHSTPDAHRAELELTLAGTYNNEPCRQSYLLTAQREYDGLFLFSLEVSSHQPLREEGYLLSMLQCIHNSPRPALAGVSVTATVRLYDSSGRLLESQEFPL